MPWSDEELQRFNRVIATQAMRLERALGEAGYVLPEFRGGRQAPTLTCAVRFRRVESEVNTLLRLCLASVKNTTCKSNATVDEVISYVDYRRREEIQLMGGVPVANIMGMNDHEVQKRREARGVAELNHAVSIEVEADDVPGCTTRIPPGTETIAVLVDGKAVMLTEVLSVPASSGGRTRVYQAVTK